jgi:hypothetical protein
MLQSCSHEMILRSLLKLSLFKLRVGVLDSRPVVQEIISEACWLCACKCAAGRQHSKSSFNHFEVTSQASWFCACQCTAKQFLNHFENIYQTSLLCACKWAAGRQQSDSSLNLRCSWISWQRQWCISFAAIQWSVEAPFERESRSICLNWECYLIIS